MANTMGADYNLGKHHPVKIESLPISTRENQDDREDSYRNLSTPISTEIDANLVYSIYKLFKDVESPEFDSLWQESPGKALSPSAKQAASTYRRTLCLGLKALLGQVTISNSQDSINRTNSYWIRCSSDVSKTKLQRFGPGFIAAAYKGNSDIISDHFQGDRPKVPHVDNKQSFYRNARNMNLGAFFYPSSSPLAIGAFESGIAAVKAALVSGVAIRDDHAAFSIEDYEIRLRIVGVSLGCAYEFGGQLVNAINDGSMLQCVRTGDQLTLEAALAWRVISGCTSPNSGYIIGKEDWRSDVAAGNHENGVSAAYGPGIKDPFHAYLEAILKRAESNPRSGGYTIAAIVLMHFTGVRYGAYGYHGTHGEPCSECVQILQNVTMESLGWFQHLVSTGEIRIFD
ncbi:hypothetical protein BDV38DRAFT_274983 [Aspergillus pseudotamarii]|uniref:Uncharacterized protein n=1 Tax=Aspergillus pseudotamarii TaxID=132259 RepID=A0A5N6SFV9_ASPPS|nr:uncharacterized protein BDV38DRAFT_274983 [Aspergillus pseudotamarii]KAE8132571.1 hypothetical protein BDV38DRAFT_274983 [Aspergillus pseudotamarii]